MKENESKKDKKYIILENLPFKLSLSFNIVKFNHYYANNDPLTKLITNYNNIEEIRKENEKDFIKFLYLNNLEIKKIIYDLNKPLYVPINENNFKSYFNENYFYNYFYLSLLLKENEDLNYYLYSFDLIKKSYDYINLIKEDNKLKIILIAKIIIELINNRKRN